MCNYIRQNQCSITKQQCPYMYFCNRAHNWIPLKSMPAKCKVVEQQEIPKGYYKVRMERKGYLYVDIDNQTYRIPNPFDDVPLYVKATKLKNGTWKLRK